MKNHWKFLLSKEFISKEKFNRLTRNYPLSNEELSGFVSRQLVETRQSTKAVATLLKKRYPNTNIEYIKAGLVSDFRKGNMNEKIADDKKYEFIKCRDVNDFHHAKDAYLNIVVGNVYTTKARQAYFIDNLQSGKWSMNKMFDYSTNGAWEVENNNSLNIVKSTMAKNNIRFTRYALKKKHGQNGGLFDQNPVKKGSGQVPIKKGMDTNNYGGYSGITVTYFAIVEITQKNKKSVSIVPVYLYNEKEYINNPIEYISKVIGKEVTRIIVPCVKINSLFKVNGFYMQISGNGDQGRFSYKPAVQLVLGYQQEKYVKKISKYHDKCKNNNEIFNITKFDEINADDNLILYDELCKKTTNSIFKIILNDFGNQLIEKRNDFISLSLYEQCETLIGILKYLKCDTVSDDLKYLGVKCKSYRMNKNLSSKESFKIINQSITGLFEQEIDLLK
jgi:CRISPR-associated endonuclease Csn1